MEPIQTETPNVTSLKNLGNDEALKESETDFLYQETNENNRNYIALKVMKHYISKHDVGPEAKELILEWNEKYCQPKYTPEEINTIMGFCAISMSQFKITSRDKNPTIISKARRVFDLIINESSISLFHDQSKVAYAKIVNEDTNLNLPISGPEFTNYIRYKLYEKSGESLSEIQLKEAVSLLTTKALYENEQYSLFHRVAQRDTVFYYDLMNKAGEIVKISEDGW